MVVSPKITKIEVTTFEHQLENVGKDYNTFNTVYEKGGALTQRGTVLQIHTDMGITGEYPGVGGPALAQIQHASEYLIGKDALEREKIYQDLKRGLRHWDMTGIGPIDICLWDIAGKLFDAPLYRLLGGTRKPLPAYASTLHGDENGGLSTPEQFADFAEQCYEMGYKSFKIHGWGLGGQRIQREIDNVLNMGQRVGDRMNLLIDPACEYENFAQALAVGRACDEANFFWYEDPYKDGGVSQFAHKKLRQMIKTPILQTEHIRFLEQHVDFIVAESTDYVRAGAHEDGGITGTMKIAAATEGFGLDVELHGPGPVHRHIMSSIRNTNFFELGLVHPLVKSTRSPFYGGGYNDDLDGIDSDGNVFAPEGPGIGVPLDWDWINAHKVDGGILAEA
ncbi:MAG: mandelate racemase [Chloroflexi bacterium]|nr:mandelate racemase [Chloroflexota bacterium]